MPRKNKWQKKAEQIDQIKSDFFIALKKLKDKRRTQVTKLKEKAGEKDLSDIRSKINQL